MTIDALRTDDARFDGLPDFPWAPSYVDDLPGYEGLRMAYLDEGPRDGHVFLCLHGQPSWSFLYRKMIPPFLAAGGRVIAPDFYGFGRSDKPTDDAAYTFAFHRVAILALVDRLELEAVTLVCQDWGGLIGLTLPVDRPALVARLIVMNTALATGADPGPGFHAWLAFVKSQPDFDVGALMRRAAPTLTEAEQAAYLAPFPDATFKAGVRTFPLLVPITEEMDGAALSKRAAKWWAAEALAKNQAREARPLPGSSAGEREGLAPRRRREATTDDTEWSGEAFMAIGAQDPVLGPPAMKALRKVIRGCPEPQVLEDAGHFVQEAGARVAEAALSSFASTSFASAE